jgi:hypothetical protein
MVSLCGFRTNSAQISLSRYREYSINVFRKIPPPPPHSGGWERKNIGRCHWGKKMKKGNIIRRKMKRMMIHKKKRNGMKQNGEHG